MDGQTIPTQQPIQEDQNHTSNKGWLALIIIGLMFFVFGILPVIVFRTATPVVKRIILSSSGQSQQNNNPGNVTKPVTTINTPCFSVESLVPTWQEFLVNDCDFTIELVNERTTIGVHAFSDNDATLAENVAGWKNFNKKAIIIEEKELKVGERPAYQIIYKSYSETDVAQIMIFVETGNNYKDTFGYPVNGFEISTLYDDKYSDRKKIDYLISHWVWK